MKQRALGSGAVATAWISAAAIALGSGCGPRQVGRGGAPGSTTAEDRIAANEAVAPTHDALTGTYECHYFRGEELLATASCSITRSSDDALLFQQDAAAFTLEGTVAPDQAGFHFSGALRCQATPCATLGAPVPFFTQSATRYAAVVALDGGGLLNIDLTRTAE